MLRFRGGSALSSFRQKKLAAALKVLAPQVSHICAEYWYFCAVSRDLRENEISILGRLLKCEPNSVFRSGPAASRSAGQETDAEGELLLVVPRPGTISPWSTKATDIAHQCGLQAVERLERGVAFHLQTGHEVSAELSDSDRGPLLALIHDRMT